MGQARARETALEHSILDFTEAVVMSSRVGQTFRAYVVEIERNERARLQLVDPAVVTAVDIDGLQLGDEIRVTLLSVDIEARKLEFGIAT
jgi:exoribonuclease R